MYSSRAYQRLWRFLMRKLRSLGDLAGTCVLVTVDFNVADHTRIPAALLTIDEPVAVVGDVS